MLILNWGRGVASAYCGKMIAEAGMDVLLVEPAGGHPLRPPLVSGSLRVDEFEYLAAGVGSCVVDGWPDSRSAKAVNVLAQADLLIHDFQPTDALKLGLDGDSLRAVNPDISVVAITPFGNSGPYCDAAATDLTVYALSGQLGLTGRADRPPCMPFGHQASMFSGLLAAVTAVSMLYARLTGERVPDAEISTQEALAAALDDALNGFTYEGRIRGRHGNRTSDDLPLTDAYATLDGHVLVCVYTDAQWANFCRLLEREDWLQQPDLRSIAGRRARAAELQAAMTDWFAQRTSVGAFSELQHARIPAAPVATVRDLLDDPQLAHRRFFQSLRSGDAAVQSPSLPFTANNDRFTVGSVPTLDDHPAAREQAERVSSTTAAIKLPLKDVRVLDLTHAWAGPYAAMQLAFLGAEVFKVEGAERPDGARYVSRSRTPGSADYEGGGYFHEYNRAKRSVVVNLERAGGSDVLLRLAARCDVLISNYSPRVLPKFKLDWPYLHEASHDLILVTMPAFGSSGPYGEHVGYGEVVEGAGGLAALSGYSPGDPLRSGVAYPDPVAGLYGALAAVIGLVQRHQYGDAVWLDVSHQECVARMIGEAIHHYQRAGEASPSHSGDAALEGVFACEGDDQWVAIATASDADYRALQKLVAPDALDDLPPDQLSRAVMQWTRSRSKISAMEESLAVGVAAGAVLTIPELLHDRHLVSRRFFVDVAHPAAKTSIHPRPGFQFARTPHGCNPAGIAAPLLDEHTDAVLGAELGLGDADLAELRAQQIVGGHPSGAAPIAE